MSMRAECRNCSTFLLSSPGGFVHHRKTSACDRPEPDFPEDPALAGLPVQWVLEADGTLRRATPEDQPPDVAPQGEGVSPAPCQHCQHCHWPEGHHRDCPYA